MRLSDWGVPGWLLKILLSYLTDRNMILRYKGVNSSRYFMPGGSPQGTLLGVLLYLVYVSDIGMNLPPLEQISTNTYDIQSIPYPPPLPTSESECRLKYVDDLTLGECVNLQHQLQHDGTDYHLPPEKSLLQKRLNDLSLAAKTHDMKLNLSKTKVLSFNFSKKYKFHPTLTLEGKPLDVITQIRLLGVVISNNGKWNDNTHDIVRRGNAKLWFLRCLKLLNASRFTLLDIWKLFCRST